MSGFWKAVGRAALGLPGTAVPRSRSIFEPGLNQDPPGIDVDADIDIDAAPLPAAIEPIQPARVDVAEPPARARHEYEPPARVVEPPPDRQQSDVPFAERGTLEQRTNPAPPARALEPAPEAAAPSRMVERIEIHRFETTRVAADSRQAFPLERTGPPASAVAPDTQPEDSEADRQDVAAPRDDVAIEPALAVVAVPRTMAADVPAVATEPPLIIEIERIDIRLEPQTVAPPPPFKRREAGRAPSLDQYLETRSGVQR